MIVSYSTLACPEWSLEQIFQAAVKYNFDAVEFRCLQNNKNLIEMPAFTKNAHITKKMADDKGISIQALWTSIHTAKVKQQDQNTMIETAKRYCEAAAKLGAGQIRVFGGQADDELFEHIFTRTVKNLQKVAKIAQKNSIQVMFETHDAWVDTSIVRKLIDETDCDNVGIVWDILATYQNGKESIPESIKNLFEKMVSVQIKDWTEDNYVLPGKGQIPLAEAITILKEKNYTGPVTFEWEKFWHREIAEPQIALPAYREFLKSLGI